MQPEKAASLDLKASLKELVKIKPLQRALLPTGLFIELPAGYEAQIRPRSGLAFKTGSPSLILRNHRCRLQRWGKVLLVNLSDADFTVNDGAYCTIGGGTTWADRVVRGFRAWTFGSGVRAASAAPARDSYLQKFIFTSSAICEPAEIALLITSQAFESSLDFCKHRASPMYAS